jgi:hypothetical protein
MMMMMMMMMMVTVDGWLKICWKRDLYSFYKSFDFSELYSWCDGGK